MLILCSRLQQIRPACCPALLVGNGDVFILPFQPAYKIAESALAERDWLQFISGKEVGEGSVNSLSTNMRNIGKFHSYSGFE